MSDDPFRAHRRLDDAYLTWEELERQCPLGDRWPDWRLLLQTEFWLTQDIDYVLLEEMHGADLEALLIFLRSQAQFLHQQASCDEHFATPSAVRWAFCELGVDPYCDLHPLVWLATTPLVRAAESRIAGLLAGDA